MVQAQVEMKETLYEKEIPYRIRKRILDLRNKGKLTSKGERMSLSAIGRTLDPSVHRVSVYQVVEGRVVSERIREAIERELGQPYWIRKRT